MKPLEIVDRYARSVFEMAEQASSTDRVFGELTAVRTAMQARPKLLNLLESPMITAIEKKSLIEGILGPKSSPLSQNFLNLLVRKNRIDLFPDIVERLHKTVDKKNNVQEATVVTARELHPSIIQLVQKALETALKKKIVIQTDQNPDLLGGIQIQIGNRLIDGTLRAKLNALSSQLRNVRV